MARPDTPTRGATDPDAPANGPVMHPSTIAVLVAFRALQTQSDRVNAAAAQSLGVGATDFRALVHLSIVGPESPGALASALEISPSATTALVDRIVATGLAVKAPHPRDRRGAIVSLTERGAEVIDAVGEFYGRAVESALSPEVLDEAAAAFARIAAALEHRLAEIRAEH